MANTKAGYVTIIGKPNTGKSTLMNALLGQKISITTPKPQTTRKRILGILSDENYQIVFLDTPGILDPAYLLQEKMVDEIDLSVHDADIIILMVDIQSDPEGDVTLKDELVAKMLEQNKRPKILVLNKADLSTQEHMKEVIKKFEESKNFYAIVPISASLEYNITSILNAIIENLPEGPKLYPDDIVSDENERFFVSEIIREKIFELYMEEVPYSCEVLIPDFKEKEGHKDFIQAEVVVEKESQKGILIGKQGAAIKKLGQISRKSIEEFLGREVYLDLRVKVRSKWRSDEKMLKSFGYIRDKE
jgi:GTP-binding protein Era